MVNYITNTASFNIIFTAGKVLSTNTVGDRSWQVCLCHQNQGLVQEGILPLFWRVSFSYIPPATTDISLLCKHF